jgi:hypothetical protein
MTIMAIHSSATVREQEPHGDQTTRTATVINALKRRAEAVLNDRSVDPQTRAIIRYGLETNDPWLAELVRRADAGEAITDDNIGEVETTQNAYDEESGYTGRNKESRHKGEAVHDEESEEKIQTLAGIICREGDEPETKSAALLVLMSAIENAAHPKAVANLVKHAAFARCGELDVYNMVETQVAVFERDLFVPHSTS